LTFQVIVARFRISENATALDSHQFSARSTHIHQQDKTGGIIEHNAKYANQASSRRGDVLIDGVPLLV
jgi:hypothetical protein